MKVLAGILAALIVLIQYPLWLGKGGWLRAWEVDQRLTAQRATNAGLERRNLALGAEVSDLKQGFEAIEERARYELGFIKQGEVFYQIVDAPAKPAPETLPVAPAAPAKPPAAAGAASR